MCYISSQNARARWYSEKDEIVAFEDGGQEPVTETPSVEPPAVETPQAGESLGNSQQDSAGENPAWAPVREALGDLMFHKIKPNLQEWDTAAQRRVTDVNSKYEPWKQFDDGQVTPAVVQRALGIVQGIDSNPLAMYQALRNHLLEQGVDIGEATPEKVQAVADNVDPDEVEDPRDIALREQAEQLENIQQFLQAQQQEAMQAEYDRQADAALENEINALRTARPGMQQQEEAAIFQRFALAIRAGQHDMTLDKAAAQFDAERNFILSTPRPNDLAPRIPGAGGGAPTGTPQQKDPSQYTREESQAYFADLLTRGNQG